jgi:hypothetical protein
MRLHSWPVLYRGYLKVVVTSAKPAMVEMGTLFIRAMSDHITKFDNLVRPDEPALSNDRNCDVK